MWYVRWSNPVRLWLWDAIFCSTHTHSWKHTHTCLGSEKPKPTPKPKPALSVVAKDVCCCGGPHIWIGKKGTKEECSKAVKADKRCKTHSKGQFFSYKDMNPKDGNYKLCGCPTDAKMDCSQAKMWHKQAGITRIYRINKGR